MYFPDYIPLIVFILGAVMAILVYFQRLVRIKRKLGITFLELYDEKFSQDIKQGMRGLTRKQILIIGIFLILALITAIINRQ